MGDSFIVFKDAVLNAGLRKGDVVSETRISELKEYSDKQYIKFKIFEILGRRDHSTNEIKKKLLKMRFVNHALIDVVIEEFQEKNYINDAEFAKRYIEYLSEFKKAGVNKIKQQLYGKGISRSISDEILKEEEFKEKQSENCLQVAEKKYKILKEREQDSFKIKQKLYTFLIGRGFNYEDSEQACRKLIQSED